ncbi:hypothetical protein CLV91_2785 [Maribacter vaceletii]|uniref:Glutaminyl-tRNA synthetase n=1 Tax=Maribacter vaceletii TaxID=1206816 RepID=A0A495DV05_9FLAO|nr:hypothetical protein [Maribacter vaceletii]RKR08019.1 hypothetical protein CLV91_2785 [Maribacter vaceletii]
MKSYTTFKSISLDLKRLKLERQIALEEIKGIKQDVQQDLQPYNWINTTLSVAKKYGFLYLIKKIIK